jgi:cysteine desulfurase
VSGYFDAASGLPLHPRARDVFLAAVDAGWADPGRLYGAARRARLLVDNAREVVASYLGVRPDEMRFTTSGTQAIHEGVLAALAGRSRVSRLLVHSAVEHSSVLQAAVRHEAGGGSTQVVPVDRTGRVDLDALAKVVRDAAVVCLQSANHEVGTRQPVAEAAIMCAEADVPLLVDAAQSVGREPVPPDWSILTASAHKWGGPAGVGVLAARKRVRLRSPLPHDDRPDLPGFPNVPAIVAAAAALQAAIEDREALAVRHVRLIDRIRKDVPRRVPDTEVIGDPVSRLPNLVTFSCLYVDGEALVTELDRRGFAVSSGSSCTSGTLRPSHVLEAMGVLTHGNVRVSLGPDVTEADVERFLDMLPGVVADVRAELGAPRLEPD